MVHRDPETGRFVSDDSDGYMAPFFYDGDDRGAIDVDATETFTAALQYFIPAADLSTGSDTATVDGEEAIAVDFTEFLDSDEVFVAHSFDLHVQITPNRTATAEHVINCDYALRGDGQLGPVTLGIGSTRSDGIIDVFQEESEDDDIIFQGAITGSGDLADSTNSLAGGADQTHADHSVTFPEAALPAPAFDQDDELYVPARIQVRGSDDQGINVRFAVTARGKTYDL